MGSLQILNVEFLELQNSIETMDIEIIKLEKILNKQKQQGSITNLQFNKFVKMNKYFYDFELKIQQFKDKVNSVQQATCQPNYNLVFSKLFLKNINELKFLTSHSLNQKTLNIQSLIKDIQFKGKDLDIILESQEKIIQKINQVQNIQDFELDNIQMQYILTQQQLKQFNYTPKQIIINDKLNIAIKDVIQQSQDIQSIYEQYIDLSFFVILSNDLSQIQNDIQNLDLEVYEKQLNSNLIFKYSEQFSGLLSSYKNVNGKYQQLYEMCEKIISYIREIKQKINEQN